MDELKKKTDGTSVDTMPKNESPDLVNVEVTNSVDSVESKPVVTAVENDRDQTTTTDPVKVVDEVLVTQPDTHSEAVANRAVFRKYALAAVGIIVLGLVLVYAMEKQGRLQTGVFSFVLDKAERGPVASVNGVDIARSDYNASMQQLQQMIAMQGGDTTDPIVLEQFKNQALDTLINGELLRQAAVEAGHTAEAEEIEARYTSIAEGVGGAEILAERMAEFGITEAVLRRDIANEIIIQEYFQSELGFGEITVSQAEVKEFYDTVAATRDDLPPLAEVKAEVEAQIRSDREQALITGLVDELRAKADIEKLI